MNNKEIENRLAKSIEHSTPDVFPNILSECEKQKGRVIHMEEARNSKKKWITAMSAVAAVLLIMVGAFYGFGVFGTGNAVDSVIALDVNPSVELKINADERVLEANAKNEDAQVLLGDMDLKGADLDVAINAIIGSMLKNGYIDELANSILVSVENDDPEKSAQLQARLATEIDELLKSFSVEGAVLSQSVTEDDDLTTLAQTYGISEGKAALIQEIASKNPLLTVEELAKLSINELNLLAASKNIQLENVDSTGAASDKAYIGEARAQEIALTHAGITASQATGIRVELDCDDGRMVYEVEFYSAGKEYDYEIDAIEGTVLGYDWENDDDYVGQTQNNQSGQSQNNTQSGSNAQSNSNYIGEDKAKEAALSHAGVSASKATFTKAKLDRDDGVVRYDIEFYSGDTEYDYEIDAQTGKILEYQSERRDDYNAPATSTGNTSSGSTQTSNNGSSSQTNGSSNYIGEAKAKEAALSHAGVSSSKATFTKAKLDKDDGVTVYDVEFYSGDTEYDYEIDAKTGKVLKHQSERRDDDDRDDRPASSPDNGQSSYIGESKAQSIALSHAGVSASQATRMQVSLDRDDGVAVYEVEFKSGGKEYNYEINASTGKIIDWEAETDD